MAVSGAVASPLTSTTATDGPDAAFAGGAFATATAATPATAPAVRTTGISDVPAATTGPSTAAVSFLPAAGSQSLICQAAFRHERGQGRRKPAARRRQLLPAIVDVRHKAGHEVRTAVLPAVLLQP